MTTSDKKENTENKEPRKGNAWAKLRFSNEKGFHLHFNIDDFKPYFHRKKLFNSVKFVKLKDNGFELHLTNYYIPDAQ